jgi:hypothetical protein
MVISNDTISFPPVIVNTAQHLAGIVTKAQYNANLGITQHAVSVLAASNVNNTQAPTDKDNFKGFLTWKYLIILLVTAVGTVIAAITYYRKLIQVRSLRTIAQLTGKQCGVPVYYLCRNTGKYVMCYNNSDSKQLLGNSDELLSPSVPSTDVHSPGDVPTPKLVTSTIIPDDVTSNCIRCSATRSAKRARYTWQLRYPIIPLQSGTHKYQ